MITDKNIKNVTINIVNNQLIMGGGVANISYNINLSFDKLRHREVVY